MQFGIVADDNTGASDAAGMLTERGVRTALVVGPEAEAAEDGFLEAFDAVVLGIQTRSVTPSLAHARTARAMQRMERLGVQKVQLKYCSTFDSTPEGNIGPSLDAGIEVTGQDATIVTPALPVNGRTTYNGYHFVNGVLLAESPLREHPLNPMTDSNLVRWLQHQTERRVDLVRLGDIRGGPARARAVMDSLAADGASYLVTDAIEQSDLAVIAEATVDWPFISGGSGITAEIPRLIFPGRPPLSFAERLERLRRGVLVVSGSLSPATRAQNALALANGFHGMAVEPRRLLAGEIDFAGIGEEAARHLRRGEPVIVYSPAEPADEVWQVQEFGAEMGLSAAETGQRIADGLASVAADLVAAGLVGRLIISGGETSGTVCARLGLNAFEVGLPIDPGVPYCFPESYPDLMVVLKSGNFGGEDFYLRVMRAR